MSAKLFEMFKNGADSEAVRGWLTGPAGPFALASNASVGGTFGDYAIKKELTLLRMA
jgi:hypothetical protein